MQPARDKTPTEALSERYDAEAAAYLECWAPVLRQPAMRLADAVAQRAPRRILDIATGTGAIVTGLAERLSQAQVFGVDRSMGMLALTPAATPVAAMDALALGFPDGVFDAVVICFALFHFPDAVAGLNEARRVLAPDGEIHLCTWADDLRSPAVEIWNRLLDDSGAVPADEVPRLANHADMDEPGKVIDLLARAGFSSPRATVDEFSYTTDIESLIRLRSNVGSSAQRVATLPQPERDRFIDDVRWQLATLAPSDFVLRLKIVIARAGR